MITIVSELRDSFRAVPYETWQETTSGSAIANKVNG